MDFLSKEERDILYYRYKRKYSTEKTAEELNLSLEQVERLDMTASLKVLTMTGMTPTEIVAKAPFF